MDPKHAPSFKAIDSDFGSKPGESTGDGMFFAKRKRRPNGMFYSAEGAGKSTAGQDTDVEAEKIDHALADLTDLRKRAYADILKEATFSSATKGGTVGALFGAAVGFAGGKAVGETSDEDRARKAEKARAALERARGSEAGKAVSSARDTIGHIGRAGADAAGVVRNEIDKRASDEAFDELEKTAGFLSLPTKAGVGKAVMRGLGYGGLGVGALGLASGAGGSSPLVDLQSGDINPDAAGALKPVAESAKALTDRLRAPNDISTGGIDSQLERLRAAKHKPYQDTPEQKREGAEAIRARDLLKKDPNAGKKWWELKKDPPREALERQARRAAGAPTTAGEYLKGMFRVVPGKLGDTGFRGEAPERTTKGIEEAAWADKSKLSRLWAGEGDDGRDPKIVKRESDARARAEQAAMAELGGGDANLGALAQRRAATAKAGGTVTGDRGAMVRNAQGGYDLEMDTGGAERGGEQAAMSAGEGGESDDYEWQGAPLPERYNPDGSLREPGTSPVDWADPEPAAAEAPMTGPGQARDINQVTDRTGETWRESAPGYPMVGDRMRGALAAMPPSPPPEGADMPVAEPPQQARAAPKAEERGPTPASTLPPQMQADSAAAPPPYGIETGRGPTPRTTGLPPGAQYALDNALPLTTDEEALRRTPAAEGPIAGPAAMLADRGPGPALPDSGDKPGMNWEALAETQFGTEIDREYPGMDPETRSAMLLRASQEGRVPGTDQRAEEYAARGSAGREGYGNQILGDAPVEMAPGMAGRRPGGTGFDDAELKQYLARLRAQGIEAPGQGTPVAGK